MLQVASLIHHLQRILHGEDSGGTDGVSEADVHVGGSEDGKERITGEVGHLAALTILVWGSKLSPKHLKSTPAHFLHERYTESGYCGWRTDEASRTSDKSFS